MSTTTLELLRIDDVTQYVGFSKASIRNRVAKGQFPAPVRTGLRGVAWRRADIDAWIAALPTATVDKKETNA